MSHVTHGGVGFPIIDCEMCGHALRCPKCGNNACNGGYGEVDGVECDQCPATYEAQDKFSAFLGALNR